MTRPSVVLLVALALSGCSERPGERAPTSSPPPPPPPPPPAPAPVGAAPRTVEAGAESALEADAVRVLPIPARSQAAAAPPSGWCGETAIQEGLLYLGMWAPQRLVNRAGRPVHPDLYATEIPGALTALGVRFTTYQARVRGYDAFAVWVRAAIDAGDAVIAGVKILPTAHPEWGLDHFVLAVGHGPRGLLVNTTWGHRQWVADTTTPGLSLRNAVYGIRLHGLAAKGHDGRARFARLHVVEEGEDVVRLRVSCEGEVDREVTTAASETAVFECPR